MDAYGHTEIDIPIQTNTETRIYIDTNLSHTDTQINRHTDRQADKHRHTRTHTDMHMNTHAQQPRMQTHTHKNLQGHTDTQTQKNTYTHIHTPCNLCTGKTGQVRNQTKKTFQGSLSYHQGTH